MDETGAEAFWAWAVAAYAREGVAPAAIRLQDECGVTVMLLLFLCWRASRGIVDDAISVDALHAASLPLEMQLLVPLRASRRALRRAEALVPALRAARERLLAHELVIERLQAGRLANAGVAARAATRGGALVRAARVLELCLSRHGADAGCARERGEDLSTRLFAAE